MPRRMLSLVFLFWAGCAERLPPEADRLTPLQVLGKQLFEDPSLSEPRGLSCASCHDARRAFSGNNGSSVAAVSLGSRPEAFGLRHTPSILYSSFSPAFDFVADPDAPGKLTAVGGQFRDGRAATLVDQAQVPFLSRREMNNADPAAVMSKVLRAPYAPLFTQIFGVRALDNAETVLRHAGEAIAVFEQSPRFHPFSSKFDAVLRGEAQLTPLEARGFSLFKDRQKGNCLSCHAGSPGSTDPRDWLFTDFTYDNLGVPRNSEIPDDRDPSFFDLGLCAQPGLSAKPPAGVDVAALCGAFKVPTLRNVAVTGPYMHNGRFASLREVVSFYATRDTDPARWYPGGTKFDDLPLQYRKNVNVREVPYDRHPGEAPRLDEAEVDAVVAFLETLTDR